MRILVTGSAGFIGSRVSQMLLDDGHEVTGVDSLMDDPIRPLKAWRLATLRARPGFEFVQADVCDRERIDSIFASTRFDAVLNLAARAGVRQSIADPWAYLRTNVEGALNILDACRRNDVPRFLLASTSSLYGDKVGRQLREEDADGRPLSPYAASKQAAETMAATYSKLYGIDVAIPRYFTVFGPAGRPDMSIFRFVRWIANDEPVLVFGDGRQSRDFTYVDDIARGTIEMMRVKGFEIVNLGSDRPVELLAMIHEVERHVGRQAKLRHEPAHAADVRATWADISKARRLLGWEPKVPFTEGVRLTVDWYMQNRALADRLPLGVGA